MSGVPVKEKKQQPPHLNGSKDTEEIWETKKVIN